MWKCAGNAARRWQMDGSKGSGAKRERGGAVGGDYLLKCALINHRHTAKSSPRFACSCCLFLYKYFTAVKNNKNCLSVWNEIANLCTFHGQQWVKKLFNCCSKVFVSFFSNKNLIHSIKCFVVEFYFALPSPPLPTIVNNCNCYKLCLLHILRIRRIAHHEWK